MPSKFENHRWVIDITSGPGGGKDTLAANLQKLLTNCFIDLAGQIEIIGMSDCLRVQIESQLDNKDEKLQTEANEVKKTMAEGGAVSFEFCKKAFANRLVGSLAKNRIVILTGVSRNKGQAEMVHDVVSKIKKENDKIAKNKITHLRVFIDVSERVLQTRLGVRNRDDDRNATAVKNRITVWTDNKDKVLKYWEKEFLGQFQMIRNSKKLNDKPELNKLDYLKQLLPILKAYKLKIGKKKFQEFIAK